MSIKSKILWAVRISWPLLGGAWGAALGFSGVHHLADNADSFGTMIAQSVFIITAVIGLLAGSVCGALFGGLTEKLLLRFGVRVASAVCVASVVNVLLLWLLVGIVQTKVPAFRPVLKPQTVNHESSTASRPSGNPCEQPPPPANSKERKSWDSECR